MESLDSLHSWVLFQPFGMLPLGLVPWLVCVRAKGNFITFSFQQLEGRVIAQLRWDIFDKMKFKVQFLMSHADLKIDTDSIFDFET